RLDRAKAEGLLHVVDREEVEIRRRKRRRAGLGIAAIQHMAAEIRVVSAERIRDELIKIFTRPNPGRGLELLDQSGLLAVILPELAAMKGVEQPAEFHPEGDVFTHVKLMLDVMSPNPSVELAFAVLLHDVGKPPTFQRAADRIRFNEHERVGADMTRDILQRLRFPNDAIDTVVACVAGHMRIRHAQEMRPGKLKQLIARPTFPIELELLRLDCLASHGSLENYQFLQRKAAELPTEAIKPAPLVTGHDLLAMGATPGPLIGQILREIEERQLDDELTTREAALAYAADRLPAATAKKSPPPVA
ncbi:MAG: HD domain-containing protein, partial [Verrucomicrobiae bacterium]|nr:HD domain-containing protein [Verrucomicrobiae bacterium]